ncbi:unnamed protein product, partial [marine sediment metagenome]
TSGFYIMVPEDDVINMDMTVEEAFKLIISGGIIAPQEHLKSDQRQKEIET